MKFAKQKLRTNGMLIVLDLVKADTLSDKLLWSFAAIPNIFMNIFKNGRLQKDDAHTSAVWKKHGKHDTYMTFKEIKKIANMYLTNPFVKRKLFLRYVLVWKK